MLADMDSRQREVEEDVVRAAKAALARGLMDEFEPILADVSSLLPNGPIAMYNEDKRREEVEVFFGHSRYDRPLEVCGMPRRRHAGTQWRPTKAPSLLAR